MDIYEQAAEAYRSDYEAKERDAKFERMQEDNEPIVKKMMGKDFSRYFEVREEINKDHALDNSI